MSWNDSKCFLYLRFGGPTVINVSRVERQFANRAFRMIKQATRRGGDDAEPRVAPYFTDHNNNE